VGLGIAGMECCDQDRLDALGLGFAGLAWRGAAGSGEMRLGIAGRARID
jgi:hypothetical protein